VPLTVEGAATLGALIALLALPGLTVVRASFSYVPLLSVSYWLVSWGWISARGPGRQAFLLGSLAFFGLLSALRLLKPLGLTRPSPPALAIVGAALLRLLPFWTWPIAPGLASGYDAASCLLLVWYDGIPRTMEHLYARDGFGHTGFGVPALGADLALLAGGPAPRAHLLALLASEGLLALALHGVLRRRFPVPVAAALAASAGALVSLAVGATDASASVVLSLALAVAGLGLVAYADAWPTTVAGGLFLAGAVVAHGALGLGAGVGALLLGWSRWRRSATAIGVAAFLALPAFLRGTVLPPVPPAIGALALALLLGLAWAMRSARLAPRRAVALAFVAFAATGVDWATRSRGRVDEPSLRRGAAWLHRHRSPLAVVCAEDVAVRAWLPALSGHPVEPPWLPGCVGRGEGPPAHARPCSIQWTEVLTFSDENPRAR
jgi:hypothetical protein